MNAHIKAHLELELASLKIVCILKTVTAYQNVINYCKSIMKNYNRR